MNYQELTRRAVQGYSDQKGIVLIALLWVLVAVSLIALNLAFVVRGETVAAQAGGEAERCYFYARGVVEVTVYRLCFSDVDPEKRKQLFRYGGGMHHFWMNRDSMLGHVAILDEAGKMDLNAAKPEILQRLFDILAIPDEQKNALMAAIEKRRPSSALTSEDASQPRPGPFGSVEELLQIKGVTQATLYGTFRQEGEKVVHKRGLTDFVTALSGSPRVNVNSAEPEVLAALPGMDLGTAASIVQGRQERPFESTDLAARTNGILSGEVLSLVSTDFSTSYCLVATSAIQGSPVRRSIKVVINLDRKGRLGHHRLAWYDEYWPSEKITQWLVSQPEGTATSQNAMLNPSSIWRLNDWRLND